MFKDILVSIINRKLLISTAKDLDLKSIDITIYLTPNSVWFVAFTVNHIATKVLDVYIIVIVQCVCYIFWSPVNNVCVVETSSSSWVHRFSEICTPLTVCICMPHHPPG